MWQFAKRAHLHMTCCIFYNYTGLNYICICSLSRCVNVYIWKTIKIYIKVYCILLGCGHPCEIFSKASPLAHWMLPKIPEAPKTQDACRIGPPFPSKLTELPNALGDALGRSSRALDECGTIHTLWWQLWGTPNFPKSWPYQVAPPKNQGFRKELWGDNGVSRQHLVESFLSLEKLLQNTVS